LIINVDIFQTVCELCNLNISAVRANSKLQFVRAALSKIHSQTVATE